MLHEDIIPLKEKHLGKNQKTTTLFEFL